MNDTRKNLATPAARAAMDAQITAEPNHGGIVLVIARRKTQRIWMGLDETPLVIAALQTRATPVETRRAEGGQR
jgi:hypothetical protein